MKSIQDIKTEQCIGCSSCKNICPMNCITMKENAEGFLYPEIMSDKCIQCGKCYKVCPTIKVNKQKKKPIVLAMINKNIKVRDMSSSGGVFFELAKALLTLDGCVCGAGLDKDMNVKHILVRRLDEIKILAKSKYVQSDLGTSFVEIRELLSANKKVLFVGTPCQVQALTSFLGKEFDNLYLVDLLCHGVPSPKVWRNYIEKLENEENSKCVNVSFRDITIEGWKNFGMRVEFGNGTIKVDTQDNNIYMFGFLNGYTVRECCFKCQFKGRMRHSDLTIGDFWGVDHYLENFNDNHGTSLVYVNTEKGKDMIKMIKNSFYVKRVVTNNISKINSAYENSLSNKENRNFFFRRFANGQSAYEILLREHKKRGINGVQKR